MSQEKATLEIIAPSVEEATEKGLDQLGLSENDVEIEVLDAGSRGLFGIRARQARVRLVMKNGSGTASVEAEPGKAAPVKELKVASDQEFPAMTAQEIEIAEQVSLQVVKDLLEKMKVHATVSSSILEPEDSRDYPLIKVDIQGADLSILIGRKAETLNALQYITNLIVGKELGRWIPLMVDVQGYRTRRKNQLQQLARRMAEQAIHTGRRQVLEPMPANERRFVHLELRDHPKVATSSIGDDPNRKVTIFLKQ
ncbi:MAG: Jag N-terminal domain-containing protein [Anaerolineaceae bacterium]|nr:Jag N-terminal domain-containing protein [Anaerolineaceae bacterium]